MNRNGIKLLLLVGALAVGGALSVSSQESASPDSPYRTIVERNPFGLKPPPPPAPVAPPVVEQAKTDLKLTGITSFGSPKAYFMATDAKSKAPEYFSLGVDEKKDGIEVLSIDNTSSSVRIRQNGAETLMTFGTHGVAPPTAPPAAVPGAGMPGAPGARPGMPGLPAGAVQSMSVTPGVAPSASNPFPGYTIPSRTLRAQQGQTGMSAVMADRYGLTRSRVSNLPPQPTPPQNTLSSEEQAILLEVNRTINPTLPPTPGLPMTTDTPGLPTPGNPRMPRLPGQ